MGYYFEKNIDSPMGDGIFILRNCLLNLSESHADYMKRDPFVKTKGNSVRFADWLVRMVE